MDYKKTIGIEVHCELKTKEKLFSPASNNYGSLANSNVNITSNPESLDAFIDYAQTATQKIKDYLANQTISK